jgi:oxygen-dependent protoporphyrinogen oxidase
VSVRVAIVGGGITGLAAAWRVRERVPDATVTVFESQANPGGQIGTLRRDGFTIERGPNGLFDAKPAGVQLARDLGLGDRLVAGSEESRRNRYLFTGDRLHRLPSSPLGIVTNPVLSLRGRLSLMAEPLRRRRRTTGDESIHAFAVRRFGREAAERLIDGVVTGIYAGDPEQLSVASCFPRLVAAEAEAGSVLRGFLRQRKRKAAEAKAVGLPPPGPQRLWSFAGGLAELIDSLAGRVNCQTCVTVRSLTHDGREWTLHGDGRDAWMADVVVTALPPFEQASLLGDVDASLAGEFAAIPANRVAVVALGFRREQVTGPQDGFGYLAPQREGRAVLGVQWCSSVFADRAPPGCVLWRALVGGVRRGELAERPDDELTRAVLDELRVTVGVTGEPVLTEIVRWPRAIPQYHVGHADRVERILALASRQPGLIVAGNGLHGVALADRADEAFRIADAVVKMTRR